MTAAQAGILTHLFATDDIGVQNLYAHLLSRLPTFINSRHESEVIAALVLHVPAVYLGEIYDFVAERYDLFFNTNLGQCIFNTAFARMDAVRIQRLQHTIRDSLCALSMSRENSFCVQNFVK